MSAKVPLRLLVVEDEEDDAELVSLELDRGGYEVTYHRVETEEEFLSALSGGEFDLIISDYSMPTFNGLRAFTLFRQRGLDIPFIFVSGALGEERAVEAMRAGAKDYLLKGELGRLSAAVQRELKERRNRERQREAVRRSAQEQRRLAVAVEASGAGVFEIGLPRGPLSYHSPRWAEILGLRVSDLPSGEELGDWLEERVHPADHAAWELAWRGFLEGLSERYRHEYRIRHADGSWRWVLVFADALERDEDGQARLVVGVMLDQTAHRQLEEQLARAAKLEAVGRLAGGIAHDFNNMLSVVLGHADLAKGSAGTDHAAVRHLDLITEAANRAASLARQLLAYSGRQVLEPMEVVPADILTSIESLLRPMVRENISLHTSTAETRGLLVDAHQLEQALVNLAVNACDAMPVGGDLFMEVEDATLDGAQASPLGLEAGEWICMRVRDTGVGIEQETLDRVFEPFFTTKAPSKGTGLGLASVDGFVRQSGGAIRVASALGQGTTFEIFLPAVKASQAGRPKTDTFKRGSTPTPPPAGRASILLVEDMELVRELIQELLEESGHEVLAAGSGEDGVRLFEEHAGQLDLLLTDLLLPGMNGYDLATRVKAKHPNIKIVFISGYAPEDVQDMHPQDLADAYLPKPVEPKVILSTLHELLAAPD